MYLMIICEANKRGKTPSFEEICDIVSYDNNYYTLNRNYRKHLYIHILHRLCGIPTDIVFYNCLKLNTNKL